MTEFVRATIVFLVLFSIRCYQCTIRPLLGLKSLVPVSNTRR